ncbi:unnamed protein product [Rhodiola kirilowii]
MAGLIEGAVVGKLVGRLCDEISDVTTTAGEFKTLLKSIEKTITSLKPEIERIEELLEGLNPGKEYEDFAALLEEGTILVKKCSQVGFWNFYSRYEYSKHLSKLNKSIYDYCKTQLPIQTKRITLETLAETKHLSKRFDECINIGRINANENGLGLSVSCGLDKPPTHTFGLEIPLQELKMKLLDNEVKVLVVCGHGGCGKSTLVKKLCADTDIKGIFGENIYFLTVSNMPNKLELNQLKTICKPVDSKPKLVILDDVWLESDGIIDYFSKDISDLKILVTSRFALPRFHHRYQMKLLNVEDAKKLFWHAVSFENDSCDIPDEDLVNKIVKICNGSPLALTVVGRSLKGQHWTIWQTRVAEMEKGQTFLDSEKVVLNCLSMSLYDMDSFLKQSFLDLGAFPEDMRIPAAALVDISRELYKEDEHGIHALKNLFQLHMRNLVEMIITREDASKVDGFCNEHFVTQHDLLRQLAIFENNKAPVIKRARLFIDITGNDVPMNFRSLANKSSSARLVSITTDETFTSKWMDMQLPKAEVLILNLTSKVYGLPDFIRKMHNLKVLIITNYGLFPTKLRNLQILGSLPSLKRIRFKCMSFSSLGHSGMCFQNLKKVSFVMCEIGQAIRNHSVQLSEMLPSLEEIDINYCSDLSVLPPGICDIPHLKRLSLTNCHKLSALPDELKNLSELETLRLHTCTELSELSNSIRHLQKLKLLDISDCCSLDQLPEDIGQLKCLETLLMSGCSDFQDLPNSVMDLVNLRLVQCDKNTAYLWKHLKIVLRNLNVKVPKKDNNLNWLHK